MITMQTITAIGLIYLIGINLAGFIIMGVDKKRAIRGAWRISEASLFLRRYWAAAWDVFWECSISGIRRSTGISNTECRRSLWYRYCFLSFYSGRSYAILIVYKFSISYLQRNNIHGAGSGYLSLRVFGRCRYAYSSM